MDGSRIEAPPSAEQRLLEGWLPLAMEASARYGWGLEAPALEALIRRAAPQLNDAPSALAAYAILWAAYTRERPEEQRS